MITNDQLADLPEEQELAFVEFEQILREQLESTRGYNGDFDRERSAEYMSKVLAAAIAFNIDGLKNWSRMSPYEDNFYQDFSKFLLDVDHSAMIIRIRHAPRNRKNTVRLDGNTKQKIHHFIQQIRDVIEKAELPDDKKERLFEKLNTFAAEVDKARTNIRAFSDAFLTLSAVVGEGFQNMEPARKWIDSIANLIYGAKESEETTLLLSAPKQKLIEASKKDNNSSELDEQIPF